MSRAFRAAAQALVLGGVAALIGTFSDWPKVVHFPAGQALVKLSFTHAADPRGGCRRLTPEEIARLPANMRKLEQCPRERLPVDVELVIDDRIAFRASLPPSGLAGDGPSRAYRRIPMPAGPHRLAVRLRDTARATGYDYERSASIVLRPGQNFVIDFRAETGGFYFR